MIQRQRENLSKYLYDLSKIVFAAGVVGNLVAWERFNVLSLILGAGAALVFLRWAYRLDEVKD